MMALRLMVPVALAALLAPTTGVAPAAALPSPMPTASPLKVIKHVYSSRMCTLLKRSIAPAVGHVLQNDHTIATSRPLFQDYVKSQGIGASGGTDMDVERLGQLVSPLVKNTQAIERELHDPAYAHHSNDKNDDKKVAEIRAQLAAVLEEQKHALDLVSGFVDTEMMGELQAQGHEYDKSINSTGTTSSADPNNTPSQTSPTAPPNNILNAGLGTKNDPVLKNDPRYTNTGSVLGYNPLSAFDDQMQEYQVRIAGVESNLTASLFDVIPSCGGHVPGPSSPVPATPVPAPVTPAPLASPLPRPTATP